MSDLLVTVPEFARMVQLPVNAVYTLMDDGLPFEWDGLTVRVVDPARAKKWMSERHPVRA